MLFLIINVLPTEGQIILGLRGGLNVSDIRDVGSPFAGNDDFFNPKASFHVGGFAKVPVTEKVFLQPEVAFSRKGSRLRDFQGNTANLNIDYLVVPLLAGIQLDDWSVIFGPQIGFNTNGMIRNSSTDFSLLGSLKYYVGERSQMELRYVQGLTTLNNLNVSDGVGGTPISQLRNQLLQLSFSFDITSF